MTTVLLEEVFDWFRFCREMCFYFTEKKKKNGEIIGGPDKIVETDETL